VASAIALGIGLNFYIIIIIIIILARNDCIKKEKGKTKKSNTFKVITIGVLFI
jgi:hypothetical protein